MLLSLVRIAAMLLVVFLMPVYGASVSAYLPSDNDYNKQIPTPESVLGFGVGVRHPRHDQVMRYLEALAQHSERVKLTEIGKTTQLRSQVLLTISTAKNLTNLSKILARRADDKASADDPLVVWLGYSVHGDEISGTNAAMVVAYHLAAAQNVAIEQMLKDTIIVIEPSVNPDGMDRFVNWVTTHRGISENPDANHIEHYQSWRTGRTNHFGFDLNRDWLLLSQQESQNRLKYFHQYQPNVLGDFHEMGPNSSYFFQPGIASRTHPLTPAKNTELTQLLATYHAKALDNENRLYYSGESFDDFYYGKGSTYPDINGGVGILFEQASSRGMQQDTINGLLTFEFGIKNHVLTSLSTITGAWENRKTFKAYRQNFYKNAMKSAKNDNFYGYIVTEAKDSYRLEALLTKLAQHQIKAYALTENFKIENDIFDKGHSYYIPLAQRQYRVIKALFNQQTDFKDNTFYDVSGWTLPLAMNIKFALLGRTWGLKTATTPWQKQAVTKPALAANAYAYAIEWHDFYAPKFLYQLLAKKIKAKVATKTFSAQIAGGIKQFASGTIVVTAAGQTNKNWRSDVAQLSKTSKISVLSLTSGLTPSGIDIGSNSFRPLQLPKILLVGGKGVSQYEAGEMLFYLDDTLSIPVTVVEQQRLASVELSGYSHILMVDGNYEPLVGKTAKALKNWLENGGVLFGQKRAASWLAQQELLKMDFVRKSHIEQLFDTENLDYADKEALAARKRIAGAIFASNIDRSHPLAYGYSQQQLPVFRNSTIIMEQTTTPFITVAQYNQSPLLSGYSDNNLVNRLANTPNIVAHNVGKGRIIASTDDLAFRGYFYGSVKIIANSLFFAKAFSASPAD